MIEFLRLLIFSLSALLDYQGAGVAAGVIRRSGLENKQVHSKVKQTGRPSGLPEGLLDPEGLLLFRKAFFSQQTHAHRRKKEVIF